MQAKAIMIAQSKRLKVLLVHRETMRHSLGMQYMIYSCEVSLFPTFKCCVLKKLSLVLRSVNLPLFFFKSGVQVIHNCMYLTVALLIVMFMYEILYSSVSYSEKNWCAKPFSHLCCQSGFAWKHAPCIDVYHLIML